MQAKLLMAVVSLGVGVVQAAEPQWPVRPLRIIVPQSAGGSTDFTARLVAAKFNEFLGQQAVVDNRPGAGSIIGTDLVAKANPDGYTILVVASSITLNPTLHKKLPFDPIRDLAPVTVLSAFPNMLAVHPSLPAKSVQELIALAKAKPGQINYGSSGAATGTHLSAELFKLMTGTDMVHVPYRGGAPAHVDIQGGRVHMIFDNIPQGLALAREGKVRALAVTGAQRSPMAPDIPTMAEFLPGFEITSWGGVLAPAGIPRPVVDRINALTKQALESPDLMLRYRENGATPWWTTPEGLADFRAANEAAFAPLIRASGARVD